MLLWEKLTISAENTDWGPGTHLIDQAGEYKHSAQLVVAHAPSDLEDELSEASSLDTGGDLVEHVEAAAFHDKYLDPDPLFSQVPQDTLVID